MDYRPSAHITIQGKTFTAVQEVSIKTTIHSVVQTASIKIPLRARLRSQENPQESEIVESNTQFARGDYVIIRLGYDGRLEEEFRGFVTEVGFSNPCEIKCEGYSFKLRHKNFSGSWKSISSKELVQQAIAGTDITLHPDSNDITLKNMSIAEGSTAWDLVKFMQEKYFLACYFVGHTQLYVGISYGVEGKRIKYGMGLDPSAQKETNVIKDDSLEYHRAEDEKIKVTVRYKDKAGVVHKETAGDSEGREIVETIDSEDSSTMKMAAEQKLLDYNRDGYRGHMLTFLRPFAQVTDVAELTDYRYPERSGNYAIEALEVSYGNSGARRKIDIGKRLS